jgi:predicted outer membrane repeat protein
MNYCKQPPLSHLWISLLIALSVFHSQCSKAVDIVVANNADAGNGTLRQAIQFNESLGGGNRIIFSNTVTGTITLTNALGEWLISRDITITGPGPNILALSGNNSTNRLFRLTNNANVTITGLTITAGRVNNSGGAIKQQSGTLILNDCNFLANNGDRAFLGEAGGAIYAFGTVLANRCTFSGNVADAGGAIYSMGTCSANNCTFFGNVGTHGGGGIYNVGTLSVTNCTLSGNHANSDAGGGVYNNNIGTVMVRNTIIAGNTALLDPDCGGAFTSEGFNLIGAIDGSTGWGALADQYGTTNSYLNALLGPLQFNGGALMTSAPQFGSPAVDQGNSSGASSDERGRPRPYTNDFVSSVPLGGDRSDIGAVELNPSTLVVANTNDSGAGSLRQTIASASSVDADIINFAPGVAGNIVLTSGELVIGKSLSIQGPTTAPVRINGNNVSRVFRITGSVAVNISSLTIANGNSAGGGAGIFNDFGCLLTLNNCAVLANASGDNGGGLANNGTVIARNCTFSGNQAALNGGGIYTYAGPVTLRNCTIVSNTAVSASGTGGGILNYSPVSGTSNNIGGTIVAGNSAASHADVIGVFTSSGYNLIGKIDYSTAVGGGASGVSTSGLTNNVNHDLVGSLASPTNVLLGPLQDNGGPTFTHALQPGSPAVDRGGNNGLLTDQRGAPRPIDFVSVPNGEGGDGSDIGAFELGIPTLNIQTSATSSIITWPFYYGDFTLQTVTNVTLGNWVNVLETPVVISTQYVITNGLISSNQFFRLKSN